MSGQTGLKGFLGNPFIGGGQNNLLIVDTEVVEDGSVSHTFDEIGTNGFFYDSLGQAGERNGPEETDTNGTTGWVDKANKKHNKNQ